MASPILPHDERAAGGSGPDKTVTAAMRRDAGRALFDRAKLW